MYSPITTPEARERAEFATKGLLRIEIGFGALAFWSDAFEAMTWKHFVVAAMLTAGFAFVSILASTVVSRYAEAATHKLTRIFVGFAGLVLVLVAGSMTWHGLTWANDVAGLVPAGWEWTLVLAAFCLSALNVIALYVFTREIKQPKTQLVLVAPAGEAPATTIGRNMAQIRWSKHRQLA